MGKEDRRGPFAGYRVIDFGQYVAGPAVAMMLADQGAEVIRVDPPEGPFWDSPAMSVLNRGKKSIVLDLKSESDRGTVQRLVATADVVIENFRPGVMDRLGVGSEKVQRFNPRVIYLSLPGFSSQDEERRHLAAWEGVVAAASGVFTDMGLNRILMGVNPSYSPLPLASVYGAVLGALSVVLSLYARERTGRGEIIEVPLAAALLEGLAYNSMVVEDLPRRYLSPRELEIERRHAAGEPLDIGYEQLQEFLDPFYRNFVCADGRPFYNCCPSHKTHAVKALETLGLWDEMAATGAPLLDPYLPTGDWPEGVGCTLRAYPLSKEWADYISGRLKETFRQKTSFEWEHIYGEAGLPGAAQRTTEEWLGSEHALASGLIVELEDPIYGPMTQPGSAAWIETYPGSPGERPAPKPDADREEIMGSLPDEAMSFTDSRDEPMRGDPGNLPLDGVKILDLTNVIAGPTISATLSRFGAEVIKLDPTEPTLDPWNTIVFGLQANRGKSSALVDLGTSEGRDVLERLLRQVDVVVFNGLERQLARLGLEPERLRKYHPDLILCRLDAYGGPRPGHRSETPGYDDTVQASTGIMSRFGGSLTTPEEHAHFGTIDVLGGFCGALATALALTDRYRGGDARVARSSLAAAGQLIQIPFMYDYEGRGPFDEPNGREVKGEHALYRLYEAEDGWLFLASRPQSRDRLAGAPELADVGSVAEDGLEEYLAERLKRRPVSYWSEKLPELGFGVHEAESMTSVRTRHLVAENAPESNLEGSTILFIRHDGHPSGRSVELVAPNAIRPRSYSVKIPGSAPAYGAHTWRILKDLGFDEKQRSRLLADGSVSEAWTYGGEYLPD